MDSCFFSKNSLYKLCSDYQAHQGWKTVEVLIAAANITSCSALQKLKFNIESGNLTKIHLHTSPLCKKTEMTLHLT